MPSLDNTANYLSDSSTNGAYTPYSSISLFSRTTRDTNVRKRDAKYQRKAYNLRKQADFVKGGHLLRSLSFG